MSEELKPASKCYDAADLEKEIAKRDIRIVELLQTLATERDSFGKRETELMAEVERLKTSLEDDCFNHSETVEEQKATITSLRGTVGELVEAGKGYLGNGCEPTDGDIVHQPNHCRQCKLETALSKAQLLNEQRGGGK